MAEKMTKALALHWNADGFGEWAHPWTGLTYYAMADGSWFRHDGPLVHAGGGIEDARLAAEIDFIANHPERDPMRGWSLIATVPKDRPVLLYEPSPSGPWMEVAQWQNGWGQLVPTHWRELPDEPPPGSRAAFRARTSPRALDESTHDR